MRSRERSEIESASRVAVQLIETVVTSVYREPGPAERNQALLEFLQRVGRVRANEIRFYDRQGELLYTSPPPTYRAGRSAPDWFKQASYKAYLMCFGSSGMFEQDDVENWTSITQMARGRLAQRLNLYNRMGIDREGNLLHDPVEGWPGPGRAFVGFGEYNQRELLNIWSRYLANGSAAPIAAR